MSRNLAIALWRSCVSKNSYQSWEEAEKAACALTEDIKAGLLVSNKRGPIIAYRCTYGAHWHIGHDKRARKLVLS